MEKLLRLTFNTSDSWLPISLPDPSMPNLNIPEEPLELLLGDDEMNELLDAPPIIFNPVARGSGQGPADPAPRPPEDVPEGSPNPSAPPRGGKMVCFRDRIGVRTFEFGKELMDPEEEIEPVSWPRMESARDILKMILSKTQEKAYARDRYPEFLKKHEGL